MRIKNYDKDNSISGTEKVIGTDVDGTSLNYEIDDLASYIDGSDNHNNIVRRVVSITASDSGLDAAVAAINATPSFTVSQTEIITFAVPRRLTVLGDFRTDERYIRDYYWLKGSGKGVYGVGGDITLTTSNLEWRYSDELYSIETVDNLPPVVYEILIDDVTDLPEVVLNGSTIIGGYLIDSNADYFFKMIETSNRTIAPIFTGNIVFYRFVGANGTYGNGFTSSVNADFIEIAANETWNTVNSYKTLNDVVDTSFTNKIGYSPVVVETSTREGLKLQLKPVITFSDLYRANAAVEYSVVKLPGANLDYYVSASKYIIAGRDYSTFVSDTITLSDGDGSFSRYDVIVVRVNNALTSTPNVSIEVLEGTPGSTPLEESINLATDAKLSVKIILASATSDPTATSDIVYDDNAEWTNLEIPTGANLDYTTLPYYGTKSLYIPAVGSTEDFASWDKGSLVTFNPDDSLTFALKETVSATYSSPVINIKLINTATGAYYYKSIDKKLLYNYGYQSNQSDIWQLININLSEFQSSSRSATNYNKIEFGFTNTNILRLDWIHIQGGVPTEVPQTDVTFKSLTDSPDSFEGFGGYNVAVKSDETGVEFIAPSSGNVSKAGTPVNNQIAVWTGDGIVEGDPNLTFDGTDILIIGASNTNRLADDQIVINWTADTRRITLSPIFGVSVDGQTTFSSDLLSSSMRLTNTGNGYFEARWNALDFNQGTFRGTVTATALTSNRSYFLPNASGTLALTSDIPTIFQVTIPITGAAYKTLNSVPVQLVATPGGTRWLKVISASISVNQTVPFDALTFINIVTDTSSDEQATNNHTTYLLNGSGSLSSSVFIIQRGDLIKNKGIFLTADADCTTGTGSAVVYLTYEVITEYAV